MKPTETEKLEFRKLLNLAVREALYNHRHRGDQPSPEVRECSVKELLNRGFEDNLDYEALDELDRRALAACTDVSSYVERNINIEAAEALRLRLKALN
jgi:hypothetical protein